jgi:hypothetical protein
MREAARSANLEVIIAMGGFLLLERDQKQKGRPA